MKALPEPQIDDNASAAKLISGAVEFYVLPDGVAVGYRVIGASLEEGLLLLEAAEMRARQLTEERVREKSRLEDLAKQLKLGG